MSESNPPGPITRSRSQQLAANQNFAENTQPSSSRLNKSIQSTKEFVKGLFPSKATKNTTITENTENSKIDKSQISLPINNTFTTNNTEFQEQNSNIFENNTKFTTSSPTNKIQTSILDSSILDVTTPIIPQKTSTSEPIYENTSDLLNTREIQVRQDIYKLAEQNLANLENFIEYNLNNFNRQNNNTNMAQHNSNFEIKFALDSIQNFDGQTPDVFTWLKQIERAKHTLPQESWPMLLRLLQYKVTGSAYDSILNIEFESIPEFTHHFERLFGKRIDYLDLSHKIGNIYQIKNESVLSYQLRLEDLLNKTKKAYESSIGNADNAAVLINTFNTQITQIARNRFKRGLIPEIECRLGLDTELLTIGEIAKKATIIEDYLEKYKEMRHEVQPILKTDPKSELINTINLEKCEKCFSTDHKFENCPKTVQEKVNNLQQQVETLCATVEKTVLFFQDKNNQKNQETRPEEQKYHCLNHPNLKNHNTDQCRGNNSRGNSNQNNQRNFNNSRNTQTRRYNNSNNNNNNRNNNNQNYNQNRSYNNNNNRQNYNHQNNGQNNYQGRNNSYRPRNNGQNYQRGCTFCGNFYHTINNCARFQLSQNSGNRLPALMGLQGSGQVQTPQQFSTQGQQQQALPITFIPQ